MLPGPVEFAGVKRTLTGSAAMSALTQADIPRGTLSDPQNPDKGVHQAPEMTEVRFRPTTDNGRPSTHKELNDTIRKLDFVIGAFRRATIASRRTEFNG